MIKSFEHKGLRDFFETGKKSGIQPHHADRLRRQLARLNQAKDASDMNLPGWRLHRLTDGRLSVWVNGNWRITFRLEQDHAVSVNYEDYH